MSLAHTAGPSRSDAGPQTVLTAPAAHGRRTWTHGGGPGSDGPLTAGAVRTRTPAERPEAAI
ncbi:hypothetical protein AB0F16_37095 [Streptomyces tanashiensis]|uniref:hypothetical protein n=1 Tax=Streptomyces tanashiensis TaxID=67367 RepID=UPI0033E9E6D9